MNAMILAAGFGTRLRPYTALRPKPLFPILGRPLLMLIIDKLRKAGFSRIIVNCHHLKEQIVDLLKNEDDIILQEEAEILGTGGGLRRAVPLFGNDPVLVTNGDIYHDIDYGEVYKKHMEGGGDVSMVMHDFPRFNKVQVGEDGYVKGFPRSIPGKNAGSRTKYLAFTGIHVIDPVILQPIVPDIFSNIIDRYVDFIRHGGQIKSIVVENIFWKDIGTPGDYLDLHEYLLDKKSNENLLQNIPGSDFWAGAGVKVGEKVKFSGWGVVGSGTVIGDNAELERVVTWDGSIVEESSHLKDTIVP